MIKTKEEGSYMKAFTIRIIVIWMTLLMSVFVQAEVNNATTELSATTPAENKGMIVVESSSITSTDEPLPEVLSVEELKKKVIELNRDLFILEEDLLFPANTQFAVFVSLDTGKFLQLDSLKLKVNDEIVAAHLYTERQIKSLQRGGMQRLYIGNLKTGEHDVAVFVDGIGPNNTAYKRAANIKITKKTNIKSLEIKIIDQSSNFEPNIEIVEWN